MRPNFNRKKSLHFYGSGVIPQMFFFSSKDNEDKSRNRSFFYIL